MKTSFVAAVLSVLGAAMAAPAALEIVDKRQMGPNPDPFVYDDSCTDQHKERVKKGWGDVVTMAKAALDRPNWNGHLEQRFWGNNIADASRQGHQELIDTVYQRMVDLAEGRINPGIRISCKKDVYQTGSPADRQVSCNSKINGKSFPGGYAISEGGKDYSGSTIVLCGAFLDTDDAYLDDIVKDVNRNGDGPSNNHIVGKGRLLLHELSHLSASSNTDDVVILDQYYTDNGNQRVYGPYWVERLAYPKKFGSQGRDRAPFNADTYAWYAAEKWYYSQFHREPVATYNPERDGEDEPGKEPSDEPSEEDKPKEEEKPTKAFAVVLENRRHGVSGDSDSYDHFKWLFYSKPYGESSLCNRDPARVEMNSLTQMRFAYPAGAWEVQTKEDGKCEYKNDGAGNAGALWCSGTVHPCRKAAGAASSKLCEDQGKEIQGMVEQKEAIVCEYT